MDKPLPTADKLCNTKCTGTIEDVWYIPHWSDYCSNLKFQQYLWQSRSTREW